MATTHITGKSKTVIGKSGSTIHSRSYTDNHFNFLMFLSFFEKLLQSQS